MKPWKEYLIKIFPGIIRELDRWIFSLLIGTIEGCNMKFVVSIISSKRTLPALSIESSYITNDISDVDIDEALKAATARMVALNGDYAIFEAYQICCDVLNDRKKLKEQYLPSEGIKSSTDDSVDLTFDLKKESDVITTKSASSENRVTMIITIDHMRDKRRYTKELQKIALECGVSGLVCLRTKDEHSSFAKHIVLVVEGENIKTVKKFQIKMKLVNIDVDAKGRPCKERLSQELLTITRLQSLSSHIQGFNIIYYGNSMYDFADLVNDRYGDCDLAERVRECLR